MKNPDFLSTLKKQIKNTAHYFGYEIMKYDVRSSEDVLLKTILEGYHINTVVDVGANEGQYAETLLRQGFKGEIYSFEPISSVFAELQKAAAKRQPYWHTFNLGIGSDEGDLMINVSENLVSSSLFKVGKESLTAEPTTRITHQEKITLTTLDLFLPTLPALKRGTLLKLDVQGFELEALKGADAHLHEFDVIQVELSFTPVYDGAPLYLDIISFLKGRGFGLFSFIPVFTNSSTGRMLQADGIFVHDHDK